MTSSSLSLKYLMTFAFLAFVTEACEDKPVRTRLVDAPGSMNKGPGNTAVVFDRADTGTNLLNCLISTAVDNREVKATSKPVSRFDAPWKHVTHFPPNPKLKTGMRADVRPRGSLDPMREGDGAYWLDITLGTVSS